MTDAVWPLEGAEGHVLVPIARRFRAHLSEAVRAAAPANRGLSLTPIWLVAEEPRDGRVVQVLPDRTPSVLPLQAVIPIRR